MEDSTSTTKDEASVGEEETSLVQYQGGRTMFWLTLASNIFWLLASTLYLWLAVVGLQYENSIKDIPDYVWEADDWYTWEPYWPEDDYVFQGPRDVWISQYMMLYFSAALCFVIVGFIELCRNKSWLDVFLIMAGGFGLASAMLVEKDEDKAIILNLVSVHLFLLEGVQILCNRTDFNGLKFWLRLSDVCFIVGALIDVALSYVFLVDKFNYRLAKFAIFAACLWVVTALIYFGSTFYMKKHGAFENPAKKEEGQRRWKFEKEDTRADSSFEDSSDERV